MTMFKEIGLEKYSALRIMGASCIVIGLIMAIISGMSFYELSETIVIETYLTGVALLTATKIRRRV